MTTLIWVTVYALTLGAHVGSTPELGWLLPSEVDRVTIPAGRFRTFYPPSATETDVPIAGFRLDRYPVTNADYLRFVKLNPRYRRDRVSRLFADSQYLSHWAEAGRLGEGAGPREPVTNVSWFTAKAYCEWQDGRLPTEYEWEYAAAADERSPEARERLTPRILEWYAARSSRPGPVGEGRPNWYGVHDQHRLVWEWVLDFNSNLVSGDSRERQSGDMERFCGAGALSASDVNDYASFMRIAFRGSLEARYTTRNLGFRCADDGR
ncbi:MAG: formylglycine-generating enzyme family protein [Polyangiaceae bacterium]|nr:formylglycine-generating enzyme family protein [Polyangiaceae bacterium]